MDYNLSLITFIPLAGVLLLLVMPRNNTMQRYVALGVSLVAFLASIPLITGFQTNAEYQFV